jgi:hypothetical protein
VYCGNCGLDFQAELFEPPEPVRPAAPAPDAGATAQCARHARNAAAAACGRCGAFMCTLCRIDIDGLVLCASCFDRLRSEGALASARTTFRSWRTLGLHLSVVGVPLMAMGVILGPIAVFAAVRGISQARKNGEEGGIAGSILSILLGLLVTGCGILFVFALLGAFDKPRAH